MKKRIVALLLTLLFIIPTTVVSFADNPTSLEAPQNATARINSDSEIKLRWTVPASVLDYAQNSDGDVMYVVDWKMNDGPWHLGDAINENVLNADEYFHASIGNLSVDENNTQEVFFVYFHFGLAQTQGLDLAHNKYSFRVRFAFDDYNKQDENYLTSPFSNITTVGGGNTAAAPTSLLAPTNLKVETRYTTSGAPYFHLSWTNPASIADTDRSFPIEFKIDFKVGNGKWLSETTTQDWWAANDFASSIDFDPVEKDLVDKIVIEENTYYFRVLYSYEPDEGTDVYSPFSNVVSLGITASEWAKGELQGAFDAGLVPDILKGVDLTKPITREEFCELAVLLYEKTTGIEATPASPNPFKDTTNPRVLKAYTLGITKGKDSPTTFKPNVLINREECATMLFRTIKQIAPNGDYSIAGIKDFPDQKDISSFAVEATKYMSKLGIVKGDSKTGKFMPKATTTVQTASGYGMATREAAILMSVRTFNQLK